MGGKDFDASAHLGDITPEKGAGVRLLSHLDHDGAEHVSEGDDQLMRSSRRNVGNAALAAVLSEGIVAARDPYLRSPGFRQPCPNRSCKPAFPSRHEWTNRARQQRHDPPQRYVASPPPGPSGEKRELLLQG